MLWLITRIWMKKKKKNQIQWTRIQARTSLENPRVRNQQKPAYHYSDQRREMSTRFQWILRLTSSIICHLLISQSIRNPQLHLKSQLAIALAAGKLRESQFRRIGPDLDERLWRSTTVAGHSGVELDSPKGKHGIALPCLYLLVGKPIFNLYQQINIVLHIKR